MSRKSAMIAAFVAVAILAGTLANTASAFVLGVSKPVKACEKVQPVPVCQPAKRVPVCQPVKPLPVCEPVKSCERVDGHAHRVALRAPLAHLLAPEKRLVTHHRARHGNGSPVVPAAPQSAAPSIEKQPNLAPAPQPPAPPLPQRL
jgi:hypothetical protein